MAPPPELTSPIVLLVEADEETARVVQAHLEHARYQVLHAQDGHSAQRLIETMPPPDLILIDARLPDLSGFDLLAYLQHQAGWEAVPRVMLSADGSAPAVQRALDAGVKDYILTPFDPQQLTARLGRLLDALR